MSQNYSRKRRSSPNNPNNPNNPANLDTHATVDEEQELMGNGYAASQIPVGTEMSAPAAPAAPWDFNLFDGRYGEFDAMDWDGERKMSTDVEGGIRTKKNTSTEKSKIGEGAFGDVIRENKRSIRGYKDSNLDAKVGVKAEQSKEANLDGTKYSATSKQDVTVKGGVSHENPDSIARGKIGTEMSQDTIEKAKRKIGDTTYTQKRKKGNDFSANWEEKDGHGLTGGKYRHRRENVHGTNQKVEGGDIDRKRTQKTAFGLEAERGKTGTSFGADVSHSSQAEYKSDITSADGTHVVVENEGLLGADAKFKRLKNGKMSGSLHGEASGSTSKTTESQLANGSNIQTMSASGSLIQDLDLSKDGLASTTDADMALGFNNVRETAGENTSTKNTLGGNIVGTADVLREAGGGTTQDYTIGADVDFERDHAIKKDKSQTRHLTTAHAEAADVVHIDAENKTHDITTKGSLGHAVTESETLEDGSKSGTWRGKIFGGDKMHIDKDGKRSHKIDVGAEVERATQRKLNLENGSDTTDLSRKVGIKDTIDIDKDGNKSHLVDVGGDLTRSKKAVRELENGKDTTTTKQYLGLGDKIGIDKDGNRTHSITTKGGLERGKVEERKLEDGSNTRSNTHNLDLANTLNIDKDGNKSHIIGAGVGWKGSNKRVKDLADGSNTLESNKGLSAKETMKIDKDGNKSHAVDLAGNIGATNTRVQELADGSRTKTTSGELTAKDAIAIDKDGNRSHAIDVGGTASHSVERDQKLDDGSRKTKTTGTLNASDAIVIDKDGNRSHAIKTGADLAHEATREQKLADGSQTIKTRGNVGVSDDITIGHDGNRIHALGGKVGIGGDHKRVTELSDGKLTRTIGADAGATAKHVLGTGTSDIATDTEFRYGTERVTHLTPDITKTHKVSHKADMTNEFALKSEGDEFEVDHDKTKVGYALGIERSHNEKRGDQSINNSSKQEYKGSGTYKDDERSGKVGLNFANSSSVTEANGSSHTESNNTGITGEVTRKYNDVAGQEEKERSHQFKAGLTQSSEVKDVRKSDAGTRTDTKSSSYGGDLGYNSKNKSGTLGLNRSSMQSTTLENGVESYAKNNSALTADTKGTVGLSHEDERLRYRKTTEINDRASITTEKNKTVVGANAGYKKDEDGNSVWSAGANASYTALSQKVKYADQATYTKIKGLKVGDKDSGDNRNVRILQKSLNKLGYHLVEDGEYGRATLEAVQDFATKKGMTVDSNGKITEELGFALPRVGIFGEGVKAEASYEAGKVEANAKADAKFTKDQVKVNGVAGAKVTMIGGNAKIDLPVTSFTLGGERVQAAVTVGVNGSVLAELDGKVNIDMEKGNDKFNAGLSGGGEAFIGAKGGAEIGAEFRWLRQSSNVYGGVLKQFASSIPGKIDDWVVEQLPEEFWPQLAGVLVGSGPSKVLYAKAGVEGRAGLGASANFAGGFKDGMLHISGGLSTTIGLGGGVKTDLGVHMVDGARLGGVWSIRGINYLTGQMDGVSKWTSQVLSAVQKRIDQYMEESKSKGGVWGGIMRGVDFIGDDLLNLW